MGRPLRPVNPVVGDRIKQARRNNIIDGKRMTQKQLANMIPVSLQAVKNWEQHINEPDKENLKNISVICNVNYYWLSGFVDKVINSSKSILDSCSPEYMRDHDTIANILCQFGYDLTVLEIENSNFMAFIKRHIAGLEDTKEIEKVINECMADYKLLKGGFGK